MYIHYIPKLYKENPLLRIMDKKMTQKQEEWELLKVFSFFSEKPIRKYINFAILSLQSSKKKSMED